MGNSGIGGHQKTEGRTNDWLTPPELLQVLGGFDLDPCAAPPPRPWDTADAHYSLEDNGLVLPWYGRVWMNPPYGRCVGEWLVRMAEHNNGLALVFARTETAAFHRYVWKAASALFFFQGRLRFCRPDGTQGVWTGGAPSVLVAYDLHPNGYNTEVLRSLESLDGQFLALR